MRPYELSGDRGPPSACGFQRARASCRDPARLERFEREAKALAALNHANLAGICGVEEQAGARYLILGQHRGRGWERVVGTGEGRISYPMFSPDARWLAFVSDESGQAEVLVKPFGRPGGSEQVSIGGGRSPLWSDDGRPIYYRQRGDDPDDRWVAAVDVHEANGRLELSLPRQLFRDEFNSTSPIRQWGMLGPDRFLLVVEEDEELQQARLVDLHPDRLTYDPELGQPTGQRARAPKPALLFRGTREYTPTGRKWRDHTFSFVRFGKGG